MRQRNRPPAFDPALPQQEAILDGQHLDAGAHEASEGVFGRADDRLAAHMAAAGF